jgi:hypothetical protein
MMSSMKFAPWFFCVAVFFFGIPSSGAVTVTWSPATTGIMIESKAVRQTKSGITVRARAYTVEYTSRSIKVHGPYRTGSGAGGLKVFGVDVRKLGTEQLGLISQPLSGIAVAGSDFGAGGVSPGFDSFDYRVGDKSVKKMDVATFEFSKAVTVVSLRVARVSNSDRDVWVAGCSSAPDLTKSLSAALASCTVKNKNDSGGGGAFTHKVEIAGVRYLLVGARPQTSLGKITPGVPGRGQFFIDSINFTK